MNQRLTKIAVITTKFLVDYLQETFSKMPFDFDYNFYLYQTLSDVPRLFHQIPNEINGVLISGSFPAQVVRSTFPDTTKVIVPFNTDDAAFCQFIIKLMMENRNLDFSRIYADLVDILGIDLQSYLLRDMQAPLSAITSRTVDSKTLDELFQIEHAQYEKHLNLWNNGAADICITRFSSLVEPLKRAGVNVYFPYPSLGYMRKICQTLLREIEYQQLQENAPAIILIEPDTNRLDTTQSEAQKQILMEMLTGYINQKPDSYFLRVTNTGFEILTGQKRLRQITEDYHICQIRSVLRQTVSLPFSIGYGLGITINDARARAKQALRKAKTYGYDCSLIQPEHGKVIGPLAIHEGVRSYPNKPNKPTHPIENMSSGPELNKMRQEEVLSIIRNHEHAQITSRELAKSLSVTQRTANRILTALYKDHMLEIIGTNATFSKGRPERIYGISS